jgi:tripartite-type tricarboxylate transporter receptor subunit TctC
VRSAFTAFALLACACSQTPRVWAQPFPSKPIRFVFSAAGGPTDGVGRVLAANLSDRVRQPVLSDGRSGANGIIATDLVAKSNPDGYTVLLTTGSFAINPTLHEKLPYDPDRSFAPLSLVATSGGLVLVVHPSVPVRSVKEFIALAKAKPGEITYGSAGQGNTLHMAGELFNLMAGTQLRHVPYKSSATALTDTLGGHVQAMFPSTVVAIPHVRSGKLIALGFTGMTRSKVLPEVPTLDESGLKGFDITGWYAMFAPAKTPKTIVAFYYENLSSMLKEKDVRAKLEAWGLTPIGSTPEELAAFVKKEAEKYERIARAAKIPKV